MICVHKLCAFLACLAFLPLAGMAAETKILLPSDVEPVLKSPSKAFKIKTDKSGIDIQFDDITNSDDYIHLDLGQISDLGSYLPGGYLEVNVELDQPVLRVSFELADPADFWTSRVNIEQECPMEAGTRAYRFYLDRYTQRRAASGKDHLYLFLHDIGGNSRGKAHVRVTSISLVPQAKDWQSQKEKFYETQFHLLTFEKIEPLYYAHFENTVAWKPIAFDPALRLLSLDGKWDKSFSGEKSWDYKYLADEGPAQPDFDASSWLKTVVPEVATPDQDGGYYWYRREIEVPADFLTGKVYLRCDDLSEDARLYVNGTLAGTQSSVQEEWQWVVENGSRSPKTRNVPIKKAFTWNLFDRCEISFPFDVVIPENTKRLYLPIFSGELKWPYAYDVTSLLKPGRNVIAARVYGNPMRGWWIYKKRDDRAARNVFGLLGSVFLASSGGPTFTSFERVPPEAVADNGTALHQFRCAVQGSATRVRFMCEGQDKTVPVADGRASAEFVLPACFADYRARAVLLNDEGQLLHEQEIVFNGTVVDVKDRTLRVNGEPYEVRGVNANAGIEWSNGNVVTKREFFRLLRFYQQEGINTLRYQNMQPWQVKAAMDAGMMVMPTTAPGSTDLMLSALGDLKDPDYRLGTDRHRYMAALLQDAPNILIWNGANEIHHTGGYSDRAVLQHYLVAIRDAFREHDVSHRPVTFANLDALPQNWFFYDGQDVVGWNLYAPPKAAEADAAEIFKAAGNRPVIFTEWGTVKGKPDREGKIDAWEAEMRAKWNIISKTPGSAGGILYAFHGEFEDDRGRAFIRELYQLFSLEKTGEKWAVTNKSAAPMREVSLLFVAGGGINVPQALHADQILPGESFPVDPPKGFSGIVEIRYDTHHGLKHFFTQHIDVP